MTNDNEARVHDAGDEDEHAWATAATNYLQAYSIMQTAMSDGVNVHGAISGLLAAKDALRSLAASATQVPQGWKLVPVEADDTMKQAGIDVAPSGLLEIRGQLRNRASWSTEECAEVYRAMIEKSPPAPQAATQGETVADAQQLDDMGALIRRLARALQRAAPSHDLPARALDYLKRKGLDAQILRDAEFNRQEAFDTLPDDHEVN